MTSAPFTSGPASVIRRREDAPLRARNRSHELAPRQRSVCNVSSWRTEGE
eukprot:CAMPEP_0202839966 /NCGR_PEP_ID=MMETSP1389-20130828/54396_1 /ASSEMBLY_ACC=CAM_ASM_000865 /TAXON_ID=302021 /ORGANISM="Rhodomonas sp., Strain CCMP768" /LENGTH=49 /DNA_ID= /DNA_START= /DNA_END= /DNA_ORIENTATION=